VRPEKRYFTKPVGLPTLVYPNLTDGNVHQGTAYGELTALECNLQVREAISGFKERRGSNEYAVSYPIDPACGIYFDLRRFARNFFTTGVVISHPALDAQDVKIEHIAALVYESFVMLISFERRDVHFAYDRYRQGRGRIHEGARFVAVYDQTYGSLRLSSALMEEDTLREVVENAARLASIGELDKLEPSSMVCLEALLAALAQKPRSITSEFGTVTPVLPPTDRMVPIIKPGSKGWCSLRDNQVFLVEGVFVHPTTGLSYRGRYENTPGGNTIIVPVDSVLEVPGESDVGYYDLETGEIM